MFGRRHTESDNEEKCHKEMGGGTSFRLLKPMLRMKSGITTGPSTTKQ